MYIEYMLLSWSAKKIKKCISQQSQPQSWSAQSPQQEDPGSS